MNGWMDGWMDGWVTALMMDGWLLGWMGAEIDGWMDGWMDGGKEFQTCNRSVSLSKHPWDKHEWKDTDTRSGPCKQLGSDRRVNLPAVLSLHWTLHAWPSWCCRVWGAHRHKQPGEGKLFLSVSPRQVERHGAEAAADRGDSLTKKQQKPVRLLVSEDRWTENALRTHYIVEKVINPFNSAHTVELIISLLACDGKWVRLPESASSHTMLAQVGFDCVFPDLFFLSTICL